MVENTPGKGLGWCYRLSLSLFYHVSETVAIYEQKTPYLFSRGDIGDGNCHGIFEYGYLWQYRDCALYDRKSPQDG